MNYDFHTTVLVQCSESAISLSSLQLDNLLVKLRNISKIILKKIPQKSKQKIVDVCENKRDSWEKKTCSWLDAKHDNFTERCKRFKTDIKICFFYRHFPYLVWNRKACKTVTGNRKWKRLMSQNFRV